MEPVAGVGAGAHVAKGRLIAVPETSADYKGEILHLLGSLWGGGPCLWPRHSPQVLPASSVCRAALLELGDGLAVEEVPSLPSHPSQVPHLPII